MDTLLEWLWTHLQHREAAFTAIFVGVEVYFVLAPGVGGFIGGYKWGWRGGVTGLLVGYFSALALMGSILMQMTHCPARVCPEQAHHTPFLVGVGQFVVSAADALAVSLPWHLLWLAPSVGCLYGGIVLRRRRLRRAAA